MKLLYTLSLCLMASLASQAQAPQRRAIPSQPVSVAQSRMVADPDPDAMPVKLLRPMADESTAGITSLEDLVGDWDWAYLDFLATTPSRAITPIYISIADASTNTVELAGFDSGFHIKATVDLENSTISIENGQFLGSDRYGDNYFYIKSIDDSGEFNSGMTSAAASVGTIANGTITFPADEIWTIADYNYESLGAWVLTGINSLTRPEPVDNNEGWEDYTTGRFADPWLVPATGYDPEQYAWQVQIQRRTDDPYMYRINCPYMLPSPFAADAVEGYIEFLLEDPDFVCVMPEVFSGIVQQGDKLYMTNMEGHFSYYGYSVEEIKKNLPTVTEWTHYADGTISLRNCRFNYPGSTTKLFSWDGAAANMIGSLTFDRLPSSIQGVVADSEAEANAPVEYYNLQGMRIQNPASGQILIRRQGTAATKVRIP